MKKIIILLLLLPFCSLSYGDDLRAVMKKAEEEYQNALSIKADSEAAIFREKERLIKEIEKMGADANKLVSDIGSLEKTLLDLQSAGKAQSLQNSDDRLDMREYMGVVLEAARDLEAIIKQSHFSAFEPDLLNKLSPALDSSRLPGMAELEIISNLYMAEIKRSGEVDIRTGTFINREGNISGADILTVGPFCAAFSNSKGSNYLQYNPENGLFYELSGAMPWLTGRNIKNYISGRCEDISVDLSKGAALKQLIHSTSFFDKFFKGGPIVWPILLIGLLAMIIAIERIIFLNRVHANTDRLMSKVNYLAAQGNWQECENILKEEKGKPVYNVLRAGLEAADENRETLESVLQEAILKELPRLERYVPALNILGAVAPLLGLLGTVTGMIGTFDSITLYGSGDPRMMSGGISEALITTMLGLEVAIPVMLVHTFLRRRVEHIVGDMEEKAVALSNVICRKCILMPLSENRSEGAQGFLLQEKHFSRNQI
ncbi:MAG: MotA/TolQ/ExbB proton channel family protein [Deltaproteobacteria bacterium]|nr:MotA/TolQ/ExbB proton channel family protein [Deltaproteobacteria bacterium]